MITKPSQQFFFLSPFGVFITEQRENPSVNFYYPDQIQRDKQTSKKQEQPSGHFCWISPVERNLIVLEQCPTLPGVLDSSCGVCCSPIFCFFFFFLFLQSLQIKSRPCAKVQQLGTLDQSAHKETALIKNFFRPPQALGTPFESLTSFTLLLECFLDSSELVLICSLS